MLKTTAAGIEIDVRVVPRAGRTGLAGERDGRLLVRLAAPPVEGAANDTLLQFFAQLFHVPRRAVRLIAGERSRQKRVAIDGIDEQTARARLVRGN